MSLKYRSHSFLMKSEEQQAIWPENLCTYKNSGTNQKEYFKRKIRQAASQERNGHRSFSALNSARAHPLSLCFASCSSARFKNVPISLAFCKPTSTHCNSMIASTGTPPIFCTIHTSPSTFAATKTSPAQTCSSINVVSSSSLSSLPPSPPSSSPRVHRLTHRGQCSNGKGEGSLSATP